MSDDLLKEIREETERQIYDISKGRTAHIESTHAVKQTYLLLRILDALNPNDELRAPILPPYEG
jgi:hypothetical protein